MTSFPLGCYIDPMDLRLAARLVWLRERGLGHIGFDGMAVDDPPTRARVKAAADAAGVVVQAVHGEPGLVAAQGDEDALRAQHLGIIERAACWGARVIVLHFGVLPGPMTREEHWGRSADLLHWLAPQAAAHGVTLALENLPPQFPEAMYITDLVAFLEQLNLPNVRLCLDSGHAHLSGLDVATAVRQAGRWLHTTHLQDNFGPCAADAPIPAVDRHLAPGLGTINWPSVIQALGEIGFAEPVMFEGVRTTRYPEALDVERGTEITLANWEAFSRIATW